MARGIDYFETQIHLDDKGHYLFIPVSACIDMGTGGLLRDMELINAPLKEKEMGEAVLRAIEKSQKTPSVQSSDTLQGNFIVDDNFSVENDIYYDWYTITAGLRQGSGYEIRAWRRDGVMDQYSFNLPESATIEEIGEAVLKCFDYINKNFGFDKIAPKARRDKKI